MRIVFFLLLFLLSVNGWGACQPWSNYTSGSSEERCRSGFYMPAGVTCEWVSCPSDIPTGNQCYHYPEGFTGSISCGYYSKAGGYWINCKQCDDEPDPCDSYRTQCEQANGVFSGSANNGCCIATCNQCGALKDAVSQKAQMCCNQGMAPPDQARQCRVEARATCGMNWSTFLSKDNEFSCQSPSVSAEASQRYADQCFDNSSSSTSDPSSSSGGGGSSGGDCPECPILEEILSTLTDQKGTVEEIYRCLSFPGMCDLGGDSLPPWVREKMDQIISYDSMTVNRAESIDSVVRVIMESQKSLVKSDSLTREIIKDGVDSIVNAISNGVGNDSLGEYIDRIANLIGTNSQMLSHHLDSILERIPGSILDSILANQKSMYDSFDSAFWNIGNGFEKIDNLTDSAVRYFQMAIRYDSIYHLNFSDSLGEYIDRIANLIGTNSQMLSHHLDSILERIPGSILDSILANQKSMYDSFDSAFWNIGNGFEKIDNLTDSAVRYFQMAIRYDSIYHLNFSDSLGEIHEAIDGISTSIGYDMGYGDTASKNLRDDLENITGVLQGMSDSLSKGSYDTNSTYNGYLSGYDTSAVEFANNLGGALSGALADSTYKGIFVLNSSSSGSNDDYRLIDIDSAQAALKASNDSTKSALADTMQTWFDELRNDFMLVNFDSAIIAPLGAKVPNTNTCPEDCFRIDLSGAGGAFSGVKGFSWGLCEARIGNMNVLQFIRLILRIITALTCVYIGLWFISGRKS